MKHRSTSVSQIIGLKLDLAIPFEALILNRLQRVPKTRRKEWLQGLLVQGFKCECEALRTAQYVEQAGDGAVAWRTSSALSHAADRLHDQSSRASALTSRGVPGAVSEQHQTAEIVSIAALRNMIA